MNYSGNITDWHQYNSVQTNISEVTSTDHNVNANRLAFIPSVSPSSLNALNTEGYKKYQNESSYSSRHFPPMNNISNGPNNTDNFPLSSMVQMQGYIGQYSPAVNRSSVMDNVKGPIDIRNGSMNTYNDDYRYRNNHMALPGQNSHLNGSNVNINTPATSIGSRNNSVCAVSSARQGPSSFLPCKALCCNPNTNMGYQQWDKFGTYQSNVPYRENMRVPGYQAENRQYGDHNFRKDNFENKEMMGAIITNTDHRRNFAEYKYNKDSMMPRGCPPSSGMMQNYPMQNYNYPTDCQKYTYPVKEYPKTNNMALQDTAMFKHQEQNYITQQKYNAKQGQYPAANPLPKSVPTSNVNVDIPSPTQNSYYTTQFIRNMQTEFPRACQKSFDNPQQVTTMQSTPVHSTPSRYHVYQQKITMQRFSMENHLRELARIPGYQSHPKYKESLLKYREILKLQQVYGCPATIQHPLRIASTSANNIPSINLQFDQNGVLINSNCVPDDLPKTQHPLNPMVDPKHLEKQGKEHDLSPTDLSNEENLHSKQSINHSQKEHSPASYPNNFQNQDQFLMHNRNEQAEFKIQENTGENLNTNSATTQQKTSKDFADKPDLDVRQFLANWDASEDEDDSSSNLPDVVLSNSTPLVVVEYESIDSTSKIPHNMDVKQSISCSKKHEKGTEEYSESLHSPSHSTENLKNLNECKSKEVTKPQNIIHCITNSADEIPTIHIVDNLQINNILEVSNEQIIENLENQGSIPFYQENVNPEEEMATCENKEDNHTKDTYDTLSNKSKKSPIQDQELNSVETASKSNSDEKATNLQKQNSFTSEESHNTDDISLPDLPTTECTPISTTLNTPIHSDSEEPSGRVSSISSNPIEIIQNSPIISFTHSPIKIGSYEHLDDTAISKENNLLQFNLEEVNQSNNNINVFENAIVSSSFNKSDNASNKSQSSPNKNSSMSHMRKVENKEVNAKASDVVSATEYESEAVSMVVQKNSVENSKCANTEKYNTKHINYKIPPSIETSKCMIKNKLSENKQQHSINADTVQTSDKHPEINVEKKQVKCTKNVLSIPNINIYTSSSEKLQNINAVSISKRCVDMLANNKTNSKNSQSACIIKENDRETFSKDLQNKFKSGSTSDSKKGTELENDIINRKEDNNESIFAKQDKSLSSVTKKVQKYDESCKINTNIGIRSITEEDNNRNKIVEEKKFMSSQKDLNTDKIVSSNNLTSVDKCIDGQLSIKSASDKSESEQQYSVSKSFAHKNVNSDFEIQVTNVNLKFSDNDIRKEIVTLRDKRQENSNNCSDGIKIEINVLCAERNVKEKLLQQDVINIDNEMVEQPSNIKNNVKEYNALPHEKLDIERESSKADEVTNHERSESTDIICNKNVEDTMRVQEEPLSLIVRNKTLPECKENQNDEKGNDNYAEIVQEAKFSNIFSKGKKSNASSSSTDKPINDIKDKSVCSVKNNNPIHMMSQESEPSNVIYSSAAFLSSNVSSFSDQISKLTNVQKNKIKEPFSVSYKYKEKKEDEDDSSCDKNDGTPNIVTIHVKTDNVNNEKFAELDFTNFDLFSNESNKSNDNESSKWRRPITPIVNQTLEECDLYGSTGGYVNPIFTSIEESNNRKEVPVYRTKDGKITYSPNPKALFLENKERSHMQEHSQYKYNHPKMHTFLKKDKDINNYKEKTQLESNDTKIAWSESGVKGFSEFFNENDNDQKHSHPMKYQESLNLKHYHQKMEKQYNNISDNGVHREYNKYSAFKYSEKQHSNEDDHNTYKDYFKSEIVTDESESHEENLKDIFDGNMCLEEKNIKKTEMIGLSEAYIACHNTRNNNYIEKSSHNDTSSSPAHKNTSLEKVSLNETCDIKLKYCDTIKESIVPYAICDQTLNECSLNQSNNLTNERSNAIMELEKKEFKPNLGQLKCTENHFKDIGCCMNNITKHGSSSEVSKYFNEKKIDPNIAHMEADNIYTNIITKSDSQATSEISKYERHHEITFPMKCEVHSDENVESFEEDFDNTRDLLKYANEENILTPKKDVFLTETLDVECPDSLKQLNNSKQKEEIEYQDESNDEIENTHFSLQSEVSKVNEEENLNQQISEANVFYTDSNAISSNNLDNEVQVIQEVEIKSQIIDINQDKDEEMLSEPVICNKNINVIKEINTSKDAENTDMENIAKTKTISTSRLETNTIRRSSLKQEDIDALRCETYNAIETIKGKKSQTKQFNNSLCSEDKISNIEDYNSMELEDISKPPSPIHTNIINESIIDDKERKMEEECSLSPPDITTTAYINMDFSSMSECNMDAKMISRFITEDNEASVKLKPELSPQPKIPKMIIRNTRSRSTTPVAEEMLETSSELPSFLHNKTKHSTFIIENEENDEQRSDSDSDTSLQRYDLIKNRVPKMKIKFNEKSSRKNIEDKDMEISFKRKDTKKTIPKVKIKKIRTEAVTAQSDETQSSLIVMEVKSSDDERRKREKIPKLKLRKNQDVGVSSESIRKRPSVRTIDETVKKYKSDKNEVRSSQRYGDNTGDNSSGHETNSKSLSCISEKIPKVIIKRASASAEFKCEFSEGSGNKIINSAKWQPEVKLQRSQLLDNMVKDLKYCRISKAYITQKCMDLISYSHRVHKLAKDYRFRGRRHSKSNKFYRSSSVSDLYPTKYERNESLDRGCNNSKSCDSEEHNEFSSKSMRKYKNPSNLGEGYSSDDSYSSVMQVNKDIASCTIDKSDTSAENDPIFQNNTDNDLSVITFNRNSAGNANEAPSNAEKDSTLLHYSDNENKFPPESNESESKLLNDQTDFIDNDSSVIKLDSSDESQSTIEILPASPDISIEKHNDNLSNEEGERLYPEDAIPTQFELELEVTDSNVDSVEEPLLRHELNSDIKSGTWQLDEKDLYNVDNYSEDCVALNMDNDQRIEDKVPNESLEKCHATEMLCCNDLLMKEVLAAKEMLKKCLSMSKSGATMKNKLKLETSMERNQDSSIETVTSPRTCEAGIANQKKSINKFSPEKSKRKDCEERVKKVIKFTKSAEKERDLERARISAENSPIISLKALKRFSQSVPNKSMSTNIEYNKASDDRNVNSLNQDARVHQPDNKVQDVEDKENTSYENADLQVEDNKSSNETRRKEDNMPVLEPEIAFDHDANSDRDSSRSPPVITNQEILSTQNELVKRMQEVLASKDQKDDGDDHNKKCVEKEYDMTITDIVTQLAYHKKSTIRHKRYCTLCEKWFPTTSRHRRHLAGYQHRHLELTQRRTIHALFILFTGKPCSKLLRTTTMRDDCSIGELTPLQIAVQDLAKCTNGTEMDLVIENNVDK